MKIKLEDSDGREFSIKEISREFGWSSIAGDKIRYNRAGWVKEVGNLYIKYNRAGQIKETTGTVN